MRKEIQKTHDRQTGMEEQKKELERRKDELGMQKKEAEEQLNRLHSEIESHNDTERKLIEEEAKEE